MSNDTIEHTNNFIEQIPSRSSRNSKLYREIYGKYEDLDNLPLEDNTDEIDIEKLRELVYNSENTIEHRKIRENLDILDVRKRNIDKEKMYDINKILEKAKYENNKLKEPINHKKYNNNILSTLELNTISNIVEEENIIKNLEIEKIEEIEENNIYMTREFKFKELNDKITELNSNPSINNVMSDSELSLDLFEDLKPTGNTIVTKPIIENTNNDFKSDIHSNDTRDIDIIKPMENIKEEQFFTNSYEFSKKDFNIEEQDDFFENEKNGANIIKIIFLLLAIAVFLFVIIYFILNYGIGI